MFPLSVDFDRLLIDHPASFKGSTDNKSTEVAHELFLNFL